jgi:hypothetical protein
MKRTTASGSEPEPNANRPRIKRTYSEGSITSRKSSVFIPAPSQITLQSPKRLDQPPPTQTKPKRPTTPEQERAENVERLNEHSLQDCLGRTRATAIYIIGGWVCHGFNRKEPKSGNHISRKGQRQKHRDQIRWNQTRPSAKKKGQS